MMEGHEWDVLRTCFIQVLEDTAFMFTETDAGDSLGGDPPGELGEAPVGETEDNTDGSEVTEASIQLVEMSFAGPVSGHLAIACEENFMTSLAANILGIDEKELVEEADKIDALKELLNVICGNFITSLEGSRGVFNLTIPTIRTITSTGSLDNEMDEIGSFDVEGNNVMLALKLGT